MTDHYEMPHPDADACAHAGVGKACRPCREVLDNLHRINLRDTPAGRALMAEAWDQGVADNERGWQHVYAGHDIDPDDPLAICQTCGTPNPYREATR